MVINNQPSDHPNPTSPSVYLLHHLWEAPNCPHPILCLRFRPCSSLLPTQTPAPPLPPLFLLPPVETDCSTSGQARPLLQPSGERDPLPPFHRPLHRLLLLLLHRLRPKMTRCRPRNAKFKNSSPTSLLRSLLTLLRLSASSSSSSSRAQSRQTNGSSRLLRP